MASGIMRVPRTMGRPDSLPGIFSISSQAIQSMSESMSTFAMASALLHKLFTMVRRRHPAARFKIEYAACNFFSVTPALVFFLARDALEDQARHGLGDLLGSEITLVPVPLRDRVPHPEDKPGQQSGVDARIDLTGRGRLSDQGRDLAIEAPPPRHRLPLGRRVALDPLKQLDLLHELERDDHAA